MCSSCNADSNGKQMSDTACDGDNAACNDGVVYKLVSITVKANASQNNVTGNKNWVTVKKTTDDIIIEAVTSPDNMQAWQQVNWWGDSGEAVDGHPNQRKLSRSESKTLQIEADLGGVSDKLTVWVVWANINILTSGTTPKNAKQFSSVTLSEKEDLGAIVNTLFFESARGKVALVAQISPAGINQVAAAGWAFKRERISHDWIDGVKRNAGNSSKDYWNTLWVDDTSKPEATMLIPTNDAVTGSVDQIFDIDGPNTAQGTKDTETYNNFRQWIEWNNEKCSDNALWYWKANWRSAFAPQITLKEVGKGNITLPDESPIHTTKPKPVK